MGSAPARNTDESSRLEWGRRLAEKVKRVMENHPEADPENVRHTLILLELPPEERLARSLLRGGARAKHK
jgi:hypothetical protein